MPALRIKRGTRAQIDAAAASSQLVAGEPYLITDENRLAIGTGAGGYTAMATQAEVISAKGTRLVLGATVESSSTSWADIDPGMAWDVEAGATYLVLGALVYQSSATTTGIGIRLTGITGSYDRFGGHVSYYTASGGMWSGLWSSSAAGTLASPSVGAADTDVSAILSAVIQPSTAGRVSCSLKSEVAGSTVRLMAGSSLLVTRMP